MIPRISFILVYLCSTVTCQKTTSVIWNKQQEEFIDLYSIPSFAAFQTNMSSDSFVHGRNINNNLQGKILRATYYEERNIVSFYNNDTKITGVYGEVWNILAEYLNFTLVPVKPPDNVYGLKLDNSSYTGVLGVLQRKEAEIILRTGYYVLRLDVLEYTMPVWKTSYEVFIRPHYKYDNKWIITMYAPETWCTILFLFFLLCIVGYILQIITERNKKLGKPKEHLTIIDHIFYTHAMMCVQGSLPHSFTDKFKILFISKTFFTWLIILSLNSNLIRRMTNRNPTLPFTDIEDLLNHTKYDIIVTNTSMVYGMFKRTYDKPMYIQRKKRIYYLSSTAEMYEQLCNDDKLYAMFEVNDKIIANHHLCPLMTVSRSYYSSWAGFATLKNFKYKHIINKSIIKMHEVGLITALKRRWLRQQEEYRKKESYLIIDLDQVFLIFLLPFCGIVLSVAILLIENIVFLFDKT